MERRRATNAESCRFESCRGYQIERTWPNGEAPGRQSGDASSILAVRSTLSHEYAGPGRWLQPIAARSVAAAYSRSLGSEHEWQCACPASRMVRLLRRRSMPGRSALTRVMVVRVHRPQPGSWPRSSVEEELGPNETVAGSSPAGAPSVFVAFWLSTTGRAPGC